MKSLYNNQEMIIKNINNKKSTAVGKIKVRIN